MDYVLFQKLHRLAEEIADTAFWSASVGKTDVEAVYDNPISGVKSDTIHINNREEWAQWRAKVEGPSQPERIKALEQRLAEATALLEAMAATEPVGYGAESSTRYCPYCNGSDGGSDEPEYDPVEHAPDCPWLKLRAFLAQ